MSRFYLFLSFLIPFSLFSQEYFNPQPLPATRQGEPFLQLKQQYDQWRDSTDLSSAKGWKWYARWAHEVESRLNGDGSLPEGNVFFQQAQAYQRSSQASNPSRQDNWTPVGPYAIPGTNDPSFIHGMGRINTLAFHPTDSNTMWVGVAQGGVWKTYNHGQSWIPLTDKSLPILRVSDIAVDPNHPDTMYVSVGDYAYLGVALDLDDRNRHTHYGMGVYKTTDAGQTWQPTGLTFQQLGRDGSLTRRVFVNPQNSQELLAAGIFGVRKSYDGGQSWSPRLDSLIWDIEQSPANPNVLYASSAYVHNLRAGGAALLKSTDFGESWTLLNSGIPARDVQRVEIAISSADTNYVYAVACGLDRGFYGVWRSTDAGQSWNLQASAAQGSPNILHWYQGNGSGGQGTYDLVLLVDPQDRDKVYAGGINLWGSEDGGQTWNGASYWVADFGPSVHADQHFLAHNPLDDRFYLCNDGGLARTRQIEIGSWDSALIDPGYTWPTRWEDISDGIEVRSFYRLGISAGHPSLLVAGSQDNGTSFKDGGGNWTNVTGGDGMECLLHPSDARYLYTSAQYGSIYRSTDGGSNFRYIVRDIRQQGADQGEWTTPFAFAPGDPQTLYAGYGQVWRSTNEGDDWSPISSFAPVPGTGTVPPASALAVAPSDAQTLYVAKRIVHSLNAPSTLWRTTDGGNNWTNITAGLPDSLYFTYLTVDDDDPLTLWVSLKGFQAGAKVYKSTDGGDSWQNISYNLPNLPANCIVHQPGSDDNIVYVGMDRGVYYLSDTASQWELYSEYLPNVIVSELEVNPTSGKLYAATFGRGVWVSDLANLAASVEKQQLEAMEVSLFPNPNTGRFQLRIQDASLQALDMQVIDITGREIARHSLRLANGQMDQSFDLDLAPGLYFMKLNQGKASRVLRFVVKL
jgi:photosystem II stability/assembly factor-like uncharacterized protein